MLTDRLGRARLQRIDGEEGGVSSGHAEGWGCTIDDECKKSGHAVIIEGEPKYNGEAACAEHRTLLGAPPPAAPLDELLAECDGMLVGRIQIARASNRVHLLRIRRKLAQAIALVTELKGGA